MATITRAPLVVQLNRRGPNDLDQRLAHHGWFNYWKADRQLAYRGLLAFNFLNLAAVNPAVLEIRQVAREVSWWDGRVWDVYRPRYELLLASASAKLVHRVDVEVISSVELKANRRKFDRISCECREAGRRFLVFTEATVLAEPRLTNARRILAQAGEGLVPEQDLDLVRQVSEGTADFCINELVDIGVLPYQRAYAAVLNLVARGELNFRLSRPFNGSTRLTGRARS